MAPVEKHGKKREETAEGTGAARGIAEPRGLWRLAGWQGPSCKRNASLPAGAHNRAQAHRAGAKIGKNEPPQGSQPPGKLKRNHGKIPRGLEGCSS